MAYKRNVFSLNIHFEGVYSPFLKSHLSQKYKLRNGLENLCPLHYKKQNGKAN